MFTDASLARAEEGASQRDDDGAKRVFFGGERFLEGISGEAYVMWIISFEVIFFNDFFFALDRRAVLSSLFRIHLCCAVTVVEYIS